MEILHIDISGVTTVAFKEFNKYIWIRNKTGNPVYASLTSNVGEGVAGTTEIPGRESSMILMSDAKTIYITGSGSVEIKASDFSTCPFKIGAKGGETPLNYLGVTTTALADGDSTNPVTIDGENVTAKKSDWVIYDSKDFIFNGTVWQEVGDFENYYTKTETDTLLSAKANAADVYTKAQSDDRYVQNADVVDTVTAQEIADSLDNIWEV